MAAAARRGIEAVRHNARPFLLVQGLAFAVVAAYHLVPGTAAALAGVAAVKRAGGLPFAALTTAFAGAILPELARRATARPGARWRDLAFQLPFFGLIGITVDLLYRGLAVVFGDDPGAATIAKKVLVDQFVFSPLFSIPVSTFAFVWLDQGFSLARTHDAFRAHGGFFVRYLPNLLTCWGYWPVVVTAVYAMPGDLQFPLFLATQAAWSLLLLHLNEP